MVAAQVQRAGDAGVVDVQDAGGVQEVSPDPVGGGGLVPVELEREQPVKVPGDDGEGGVQVDVERDAAGETPQGLSCQVRGVFCHYSFLAT